MPRIEAEDLKVINGFSVKSNGAASGGFVLQASTAGTAVASHTFTGSSGLYSINLSYFDENDGVSELKVYVNDELLSSWLLNKDLGSANANSSTLTSKKFSDIALSSGDVIRIEGQKDGNEALRLDALDLTRTGDIPQPEPTPEPVNGELVATYEAESMALNNFNVKALSAASGGNVVQASSNAAASAKTTFNGQDGIHSIVIQYFDENDGVSEMTLRIDGVDIETWTWNQNLGSALANSDTQTQKSIDGITLTNGSVIELIGTKNGSEPLRLDKVEVFRTGDISQPEPTPEPAPDPGSRELVASYEAESMALSNFKVQALADASESSMVQARSDATATAKTTFTGQGGNHSIVVQYFDENDGASQMTLRVDGVDVATWTWDQDLGSSLANSSTLTQKSFDNITLQNGSVIELVGNRNGGEPLRLDKVEVFRIDEASSPQPEPSPSPDPTPNPVPPGTDPISSPPSSAAEVKAFAGAEGFGADSIGGRGGKVIHVTNLKNSGAGSLREALEVATGPRIVVFDVEGQIHLNTAIKITNPYVTIAGQTAPGEGIVVSGSRIHIGTNDVIMRGMKIRPGDDPDGDAVHTRDSVSIGGKTSEGVENIVVDHNSFTWASDETLSVWGTAKNVSLTNNIIGESLHDSIHIDDGKNAPNFEMPHGKGMIIGHKQNAPEYDNSQNITIAKNLFASNQDRNANVKMGENIEFVNNYVSNFGSAHHSAMAVGGAKNDASDRLIISIKGNYYEGGQDSKFGAGDNLLQINGSYTGSKIYVDGNNENNLRENNVVKNKTHDVNLYSINDVVKSDPFAPSDLTVLNYRDVKDHVLNNVGARVNGELDAVDSRILTEVANGTTKIIDVINVDHYNNRPYKVDVGATKATGKTRQILSNEKRELLDESEAYGAYSFTGQKVQDYDDDGMADWFEIAFADFGFDYQQADDKLDYDNDGYTNIEEYINGLITGFDFGPQGHIYGTNGSDVFSIKKSSADTVVLHGFKKADDYLDIGDILETQPSSVDQAIADYVNTTYNQNTGDVSVYVDKNGATGGQNYALVAIIEDAGRADVIDSGNLVI